MGCTGPLEQYGTQQLTGGLVKPVRLLNKVAATAAAGLLALGIVVVTSSAAAAGSGEIGRADSNGFVHTAASEEIGGGSGEIGSAPDVLAGGSGEIG
jgi:hypothetical protein